MPIRSVQPSLVQTAGSFAFGGHEDPSERSFTTEEEPGIALKHRGWHEGRRAIRPLCSAARTSGREVADEGGGIRRPRKELLINKTAEPRIVASRLELREPAQPRPRAAFRP